MIGPGSITVRVVSIKSGPRAGKQGFGAEHTLDGVRPNLGSCSSKVGLVSAEFGLVSTNIGLVSTEFGLMSVVPPEFEQFRPCGGATFGIVSAVLGLARPK